MYIPPAFAEHRVDVLHAFMAAHAFATIVTTGEQGLVASHVPIILIPSQGTAGTIQLHLAKPNPQCDHLAAGREVLAIFQGVHGYISPTWYAAPAAVPTWNYVAVHAYGTPRVLDDEQLRQHLDALVAAYEASRPAPWSSTSLPDGTDEQLRRAIVGFEIPIGRIEGKWKLGQNRPTADRVGATSGLRGTGRPDDSALADWMERSLADARRADQE